MSDDPPPEDFNYGDKLDDGQYENHPTIDEGSLQQEMRISYVHEECGKTTTIHSRSLAKSIARDPDYYSKTFCTYCREYVPTGEVHWEKDGKSWKVDNES